MEHILNNPVYNALVSGDARFNKGNNQVKFFEEAVSPFAGFLAGYENGFKDLNNLLSRGRKILYANPKKIETPKAWTLLAKVAGLQFVLDNYVPVEEEIPVPVPLGQDHIKEMMKLTELTKPGPFEKRTIEFGHYFGIFQNEQLVAITGQRLHVFNFTEISAVCTHPDYLGKGFAGILLRHQIALILKMGQTPFLHVRADNMNAIKLYKKIGFTVSRPMNFYFLQKQ